MHEKVFETIFFCEVDYIIYAEGYITMHSYLKSDDTQRVDYSWIMVKSFVQSIWSSQCNVADGESSETDFVINSIWDWNVLWANERQA